MTNWILKAKQFAGEKHANQKYGKHSYMYHIEEVLSLAEQMGLSEELRIVSILHDTIEDTDTNWEELKKDFGTFVAEIVFILTKQENETYEDYIERVSENKYARKVKVLDLMCNLKNTHLMEDSERKNKLIDKYQKSLFFLCSK